MSLRTYADVRRGTGEGQAKSMEHVEFHVRNGNAVMWFETGQEVVYIEDARALAKGLLALADAELR